MGCRFLLGFGVVLEFLFDVLVVFFLKFFMFFCKDLIIFLLMFVICNDYKYKYFVYLVWVV